MSGVKRKSSSFALPDERPSKLAKRTTSASRTLSGLSKTRKTASLRTLDTTKRSKSPGFPEEGLSPTPALRRASTLTLDDDEPEGVLSARTKPTKKAEDDEFEDFDECLLFMKTVHPKRSKKVASKKVASLFKKFSGVEEGALTTRLSGLKSGSLVGETSMKEALSTTKKASVTKTPSKKASSTSTKSLSKSTLSKTKSISSTHLSKSAVDSVDESEMPSALASLRSHVSAEKSKTADVEMPSEEEVAAVGASTGPADVALPPGGLVEVAISFDTTGSMYGCLEEVKSKIQDLVQRLQGDIPGIRIAIIAHGDYCDASNYVVKWIDFGGSVPEVCDFVKNAGRTGGGDGPECYELVLQRAREVLSWTPGSQRVLVMIGDNVPHEPGYKYGRKTYHINWRDECALLRDMAVKVYGVQAGVGFGFGFGCATDHFHQEMARLTNGSHLKLSNFSNIFDFLMMICYREGNPDMMPIYEQEVRARHMGGMAKDFEGLTKTLGGASPPTAAMAFPTIKAKKVRKTTPAKKAAKGIKPKEKSPSKSKVAKPKRVGKKKKKTLLADSMQKREKIPDSSLNKGLLKKLNWTRWVCGIVPTLPAKASTKYKPCFATAGFRRKTIFDGDMMTPAVYEFAVQVGGKGKRHVVYYRKMVGCLRQRKMSWDLYFVKNKCIQDEINNAMKAGNSIWVRRGTLKADKRGRRTAIQAKVYLDHHIDYAWKKYIWRKTGDRLKHRHVTVKKRGSKAVVISNGSL